MILVDTSILVDFLRSPSPEIRAVLMEQGAAICGVTRSELLCGARTKVESEKIHAALNGFTNLEIPESAWHLLGEHLQTLRSRGVVVPFQDALIATIAILYNVPVWTRDGHFQLMQTVLPDLQLHQAIP